MKVADRFTRTATIRLAAIVGAATWVCAALPAGDANSSAQAAETAIAFSREAQTILESRCLKCHGDQEPEGGL
ncbi:MAG: hypothetical protein AB7U20_01155, partial [Planctomycetaceae bacterium]